MGWDGAGWDGMGWNGMGWGGMGWGGMGGVGWGGMLLGRYKVKLGIGWCILAPKSGMMDHPRFCPETVPHRGSTWSIPGHQGRPAGEGLVTRWRPNSGMMDHPRFRPGFVSESCPLRP